MCNDGFNTLIRRIRSGCWISENTGGVKDIKTFVFHRPHVEVINSNNHENIQIVFAAVNLFIPTHGSLKGIQRVFCFINVLRLDENAQQHFAPRTGREVIIANLQVTRD